MTSEESSVCFLRREGTWAIVKSAGTQPMVRDEVLKEVRNGRRAPKMFWRREDLTSHRI